MTGTEFAPAPARYSQSMSRSVGMYVHVPFCAAKCHYCDFNSYAGLDRLVAPFVEAACLGIERLPQSPPESNDAAGATLVARSINFGGGTPSLLAGDDLGRILGAINRRMALSPSIEISVEANPGTVAESRLETLRALGVNRLSFGVQSFDANLLTDLGRIHSADDAARARRAARAAGFENVNLDFIYGLPRQTLPVWRETLERALELHPEHLSLYALTVEAGTVFFRRHERGNLPLPDEDLVADMYEMASEMLEAAGYEQYEISNWSLTPELRCQHNLGYWQNLEYLGVGPGAHSWYGGRRYVETLSPSQWTSQIQAGQSPVFQIEEIDRDLELGETIMLGLRLLDGLDLDELGRRFAVDIRSRFGSAIEGTISLGLCEVVDRRLRLTRRARLLGNEVFERFLTAAVPIAA